MSFEIPAGELVDLCIEKLSIVTSPASRCVWLIKKSDEGGNMEELLDIYNNIFDEELTEDEISKAEFTATTAKEVLTILGKYVDDVPDELVAAWKKISKLLVKFVGYGAGKYPYPEKEPEKKIEKSKDKWKSLGMTGNESDLTEFVQKVQFILGDKLEHLRVEKDGTVHSLGEKTGLEGRKGGGPSDLDPNDRWPSLGPC